MKFRFIQNMRKISFVFLLTCSLSVICQAQSSKSVADAEKHFCVRNYAVALLKFEEAIRAGEKNPMVHYKTGVCYQKNSNVLEHVKALPYFEYAVKNGAQVPNTLHFEMGEL